MVSLSVSAHDLPNTDWPQLYKLRNRLVGRRRYASEGVFPVEFASSAHAHIQATMQHRAIAPSEQKLESMASALTLHKGGQWPDDVHAAQLALEL